MVIAEHPSQFQMWKQLKLEESFSSTTTFICSLWSMWLFSREINHNKQCRGLDSWFKQSLGVPELSEVQLCCPHRLVQQASARFRRLSASTVSLSQAWEGCINVISCTGNPSGVSCQASTVAGRPKRTIRVSIQPLAHGWMDRKLHSRRPMVTSGPPEAGVWGSGGGVKS